MLAALKLANDGRPYPGELGVDQKFKQSGSRGVAEAT